MKLWYKLFWPWFSHKKSFRMKCGGTWYKVIEPNGNTEWQNPEPFWTNELPGEHLKILNKEEYFKPCEK